MPTVTTAAQMLALYARLTPRDRALLALLDEHRVLTTGQIHRLQYQALRTCQVRLRTLHQMAVLDRFRFARLHGGSDPWHWTLGIHGARFRAGATGRPSITDRSHRDRIIRLTARPDLAHLITTNEFFTRLTHTARTDSSLQMRRWWSERTTTARFLRIRPDAHGIAVQHGHTVGWFLEVDRGTEALSRVVAKLDAYAQLTASGGPRYPVLFWLPTTRRETHLHQMLQQTATPVPVATAVHDTDPAGAVWLTAGGRQRITLAGLDSDHGPHSAANPNWVDGALDLSDQGVLAV